MGAVVWAVRFIAEAVEAFLSILFPIRSVALPCLLAAGFVALMALDSFGRFDRVSAQVSAGASAQTADGAGFRQGGSAYMPAYTADGDMVPPLQYREWVYVTSGFNMSYTAKAGEMSMFDNVFVNPEAYRSFVKTGTWPDKTVMVLESRGAESKGSINKAGSFQSGGVMGLELHVKDEKRFPGKWAFFDVASETKATLIPEKAPCYSCHRDHAAVDTTFVQFYPTLLPIAQKIGTVSAAYLKETQGEVKK